VSAAKVYLVLISDPDSGLDVFAYAAADAAVAQAKVELETLVGDGDAEVNDVTFDGHLYTATVNDGRDGMVWVLEREVES
jgi:hypothetical protein